LNQIVSNKELFAASVLIAGIIGVSYGIFTLKITKLGFKMRD